MPKSLLLSLTRKGSFLGASALGLGSAVISRGTVFAINIVLAHVLSVHDYGVFSYAYVTALNLGMFLATGVSQAAGHVLPAMKPGPGLSRQLQAFLLAALVLAAVAAALLFGFSDSVSRSAFGSADGRYALHVAAGLLFCTVVMQAAQGLLYAQHEHRWAALNGIGVALLTMCVVWVLHPISGPAAALAIFVCVNTLGAVGQLAVLFSRQFRGGGWCGIGMDELRRAVRAILPATLTTSLGAPVHWLCVSALAAGANGVHELALFSVSFQWYVVITFIPSALGNLALPFLSARHEADGKARARRRFRMTFAIAGSMALVLGVGTYVLAGWLLRVFYPASYAEAAASVRALACAATLCGISVVLQQQIAATGRFWLNFRLTLVYSAIYFGGTTLLVRLGYGAPGLGIAMSVAYVVLLLLQGLRLHLDARADARAVQAAAFLSSGSTEQTGVRVQ